MNNKKMRTSRFSSFAEDLIENLPVGVMILDKNGKIIRMNKKQEEASQIKRDKILGRTFPEAFPKALEQGLKEPYSNLLKNRAPFDIVIDPYIPQYYSEKITYRSRGSAFPLGKYFVILNEHEEVLDQEKRLVEKKTEELQESKNFLESLIDSSPNIVISTDLNDRILVFNKTAERIFGYAEEDVLQKRTDFLFKEGLRNPNPGEKATRPSAEILCTKKGGGTFPASLKISDIKNGLGDPIAKLILISDLTEKKQMEERLFLTEKLALYTELMGGIAHQLNNPLIGVVNFSDMLLKEMDHEDPKKELAETISKAGKECLKFITSALNSIKDPYLTFTKTNIQEVLISSVHSLKEQYGEKLEKINLRTKMHPKISPIMGDSIQLKQCFLNILINAMQAMQNNGELRVETEYDEKKKEARIIFSDTGIGIPKEYLNKIFLPFFSLHKIHNRHGLGLSFAYQIIKNHGGHIYVESEVGMGSTFTIVLPTS